MNVYQKLAEARYKLKAAGLKQSGKNKGVGYTYFDLTDILPHTTKIEKDLGLLSCVSFTETTGTLTMLNTDKPEEVIIFTSPLRDAELRGCHPVQNLGAVETYVRRYLYLLAYEIVETETLDMTQEIDTSQSQEKPKSKYAIINDILKGSDYDLKAVNQFIVDTFGDKIKINDLTDVQFDKVVSTLQKNINLSTN